MDLESRNRQLLEEQEDFIRKSLPPTFEDIRDEIIKGKRAQIGEVRQYGGVSWKKVSSTGNPNKDWVRVKGGGDGSASEGGGEKGKEGTPDIGEAAKSASEGALQNAIKLSNDPKVREAAHRELERRKNEEATDTFKAPDGGEADKKDDNSFFNEHGVHKGYISLTKHADFVKKAPYSEPLSKVVKGYRPTKVKTEEEKHYLDKLPVHKMNEVPTYNPDKTEDNYVIESSNGDKYLVDTQGFDYPRYITKLDFVEDSKKR